MIINPRPEHHADTDQRENQQKPFGDLYPPAHVFGLQTVDTSGENLSWEKRRGGLRRTWGGRSARRVLHIAADSIPAPIKPGLLNEG